MRLLPFSEFSVHLQAAFLSLGEQNRADQTSTGPSLVRSTSLLPSVIPSVTGERQGCITGYWRLYKVQRDSRGPCGLLAPLIPLQDPALHSHTLCLQTPTSDVKCLYTHSSPLLKPLLYISHYQLFLDYVFPLAPMENFLLGLLERHRDPSKPWRRDGEETMRAIGGH